MLIAPPVLAATISENFVATVWVGCSGVSGWPSLRVTAPWAKARSGRQIVGMATPAARLAAEVRKSLRVMFVIMNILPKNEHFVERTGFRAACAIRASVGPQRWLAQG